MAREELREYWRDSRKKYMRGLMADRKAKKRLEKEVEQLGKEAEGIKNRLKLTKDFCIQFSKAPDAQQKNAAFNRWFDVAKTW